MNGDTLLTLRVPLKFFGPGCWKLRAFADTPASAAPPERTSDTTTTVGADDTLELNLAPAGGYAAVLSAP